MAYKKTWPLAILGALILITLIVFFTVRNQNNSEKTKEIKNIRINNQIFRVEEVSSPADMYLGLSGRESLCQNCGMLFTFSDLKIHSFVMRDMLIPLDIIFLADSTIVNIYKNLPPEGSNVKNIYESTSPANNVLEINAGQADMLGLKVGGRLEK